jgi:hypothetical protein
MALVSPTEGLTVVSLRGDDSPEDTFTAARVEATPEGLHAEFVRVDEDGRPTGPWTVFWDRLTAERIARAILAELAATRR